MVIEIILGILIIVQAWLWFNLVRLVRAHNNLVASTSKLLTILLLAPDKSERNE